MSEFDIAIKQTDDTPDESSPKNKPSNVFIAAMTNDNRVGANSAARRPDASL